MANPYAQAMAAAFEDELVKIAQEKVALSPEAMKTIGLVGAGAVGAEMLRRAERDRRMGRAMRMQQTY
jgi:phosphoglycerate dehydrogenase-like enzyme